MATISNKAFKLSFDEDDNADIVLEEGTIKTVTGREEWLQANKLGLIGQEGDWLFDPAEGLPWVEHRNLAPGRQHILGSSPPPRDDFIRVYVYEQLLKEPRNEDIKNIEISWDDKQARKLGVKAEITSVDQLEGEVEV